MPYYDIHIARDHGYVRIVLALRYNIILSALYRLSDILSTFKKYLIYNLVEVPNILQKISPPLMFCALNSVIVF